MRVDIYDTTLRDGSQGEGVNFSVQDKLLITQKLDELGIDFIEGGYPLSNPKDAQFFEEITKLRLRHALVCAFGMTRRKGIEAHDDTGMQALVHAQTPIVTMVGKTWDLHVTEVLRVEYAENLAMIRDSIQFLVAQGRRVFYDAEHFFDGLRANRDYALETLATAESAGAEVLILCDTNGGSLPAWIEEAVSLVRSRVSARLGIHCHNDSDLATANSLAAIAAGASQVQGTINGLGERCGNADLTAIVPNLVLKLTHTCNVGSSLTKLCDVSRYVFELANMNFRPGQPFVGSSAFAHKGGMHVHAVQRIPASYEHIPPETVGNQRRILISELSGQSNVMALDAGKYQLSREQAIRVLQRVQDLEHAGYQFEAAEASYDLLIRSEIETLARPFRPIGYRVNIEKDPLRGVLVTEATVKVEVADVVYHTVAEGDGPVNALDAALRKALESAFPRLSDLRLVDYKVRVVNQLAGTAARVRVTIESRDSEELWGTVGVDENIVEASWHALLDSFTYKLTK